MEGPGHRRGEERQVGVGFDGLSILNIFNNKLIQKRVSTRIIFLRRTKSMGEEVRVVSVGKFTDNLTNTKLIFVYK